MFKNKKLSVLFVITLFFCSFMGCGYKQLNVQHRDVAYLKFKKSSFNNYSVLINEKYSFQLSSCVKQEGEECHDTTSNKLYEVTSGNVVIEVTDNRTRKLILRKEMYIGSSNTAEIILP